MENKNHITLEELKEKEQELKAEYNENVAKDWGVFAEHSLECLRAVRYVMTLIDGKSR